MSDSPAYIAGIGSTPWSWPRTHLGPVKTRAAAVQLSLSAGTKALLDAGVSYDDVDHAFVDEGATEIPYTFGKTGIPIQRAGTESGVYAAARLIGTGSAHCVLLIGVDQQAAVGVVLVSEAFLWRHPYLKDTSPRIRGCALGSDLKGSSTLKSAVDQALRDAQLGSSDVQYVRSNSETALDDLDINRNTPTGTSTTALSGLCEIVWLLRGWTSTDYRVQNCLQCSLSPNGTATAIVLSRGDGKDAPAFDEMKHKNDGRDRLSYNPALETREISVEDWEAVKARTEYSDERAVNNVKFRKKGGDRAALAKL